MARRLRVQYDGAIYHLTMRGVERRPIFRDDGDRERFLVQLAESVDHFGVRLYLYCLMTNHVHVLVETPRGNLSAFMQRLQTAYTVYFNRKHKRAGHLMQGRYGSKVVQGDDYLLKLSRYIHLNPVFVGAMTRAPLRERLRALRQYRWSSYRGYVGRAKPEARVDSGPMLAMMPGRHGGEARAYQRFVESGLAHTDEEFMGVLKDSSWGIGDLGFRARVQRAYELAVGRARRPEDVSFRRVGARTEPEVVLATVAGAFGVAVKALKARGYRQPARTAAMCMLGKYAGLNQREVAEYLQVGTGSAVCRAMGRLAQQRKGDRELDATIKHLDSLLNKQGRQGGMSIVKG